MFGDYLKLPRSVHLIITMEFCERFCYYGMRTILILYLVEFLGISSNSSTSIFHGFIFMCYLSPILGALLADGMLGKYRTILVLSCFYTFGCILLTSSAFPMQTIARWSLAGIALLVISIGTGGIKPCVGTFGAEQIEADQTKLVDAFFAAFYLVINVGSLVSTALSPVLRAEITCFGHDCYSVAFGTMTILMVMALVAFLSGSKLYKNKNISDSSIAYFIPCVWTALKRTVQRTTNTNHPWIYRASDKYSEQQITDAWRILSIFKMLIPVPIFWSLFDQMGSRWTLQALELDGGIVSHRIAKALNSILVMIFVPFFQSIVYPLLAFKNLLKSPVSKMFCGMLLAVLAFLNAATLEFCIKANYDKSTESLISIINLSNCSIISKDIRMKPLDVEHVAKSTFTTMKFTDICSNQSITVSKSGITGMDLILFQQTTKGLDFVKISSENIEQSNKRKTWMRCMLFGQFNESVHATIEGSGIRKRIQMKGPGKPTSYLPYEPQKYSLSVTTANDDLTATSYFHNGASYTILFYKLSLDDAGTLVINQSKGTSISILWQIPQYIFMTIGEVMFAVTGMQFVFHEAPNGMRSIAASGWLLTTAIGNALVAIVIQIHMFKNQTIEYLFFAGLMTFAAVIFWLLSRAYSKANLAVVELKANEQAKEWIEEPE